MDEISEYNRERWEALAKAKVAYSRPALDLTRESARAMVDPEGAMGDVAGRDVLCLAGGGGQQSAAFGLLGAHVTVLDLSPTQLQRDRATAEHYGIAVQTVEGDMRDLSCFPDNSFDIVWHAHSLTFVPNAETVFDEVARVLRREGLYRLSWTNPFVHGLAESKWDGRSYPLNLPYEDGAEVTDDDPYWDVQAPSGGSCRVLGPREFRHTLGAVVNGLVSRGFQLRGIWEDPAGDFSARPGSWDHFVAVAPPWLILWAALHA
jgi:SAM-dependent methyltransferase